jgi:CheY-like chemotaxis protein
VSWRSCRSGPWRNLFPLLNGVVSWKPPPAAKRPSSRFSTVFELLLSYRAIGSALYEAYQGLLDDGTTGLGRLNWFAFIAFPSSPPKLYGEQPNGSSFLPDRNVVFVVDDDPGMLMSVKRLLRANGYDSLLFSSAKAFNEQVDFEDACCVVLDINLADGSGIELGERLKAAGISVPVIFITGSDNAAARAAAIQSGCIAYLEKPFSTKSLMEPIKRASAGLN